MIDTIEATAVRPRPTTRAFVSALTAIAAGALGLRIAYVMAMRHRIHFGLDAIWYELVSGTIAKGDGFVDPQRFYSFRGSVPTAFRPPLYPTFLALVSKTAGDTRLTFQLAGCVAGTVTVVLAGVLGRRLAGPTVGLVAAGLVACSPILLAVHRAARSIGDQCEA